MQQTGYSNGAESFTQFLTVFLVFLLVLALTYFTTRFVGSFQKSVAANRNFEAIETYKITNGKYLQLVRIGEKYVVIGVSKDNITNICEVSEDDIVIAAPDSKPDALKGFATMLDKAKERIGKGGNRNEK